MFMADNTICWQDFVIFFAGQTDRGRRRNDNEDNFLILPEIALFCIADGAGGHHAGSVASSLTLSAISSMMTRGCVDQEATMPLSLAQNGAPAPLLVRAIKFANRQLFDSSQTASMASTIVAVHISDTEVQVCHVGDSRAYLLRQDRLQALTEDHSMVYELYRAGRIGFEEMRTHPRRNVITRAIGPAKDVVVSFMEFLPERNDIVLLCSDGLTSMVPDDEIKAIIKQTTDMALAANALVEAANQAGGADNITVILLQFV